MQSSHAAGLGAAGGVEWAQGDSRPRRSLLDEAAYVLKALPATASGLGEGGMGSLCSLSLSTTCSFSQQLQSRQRMHVAQTVAMVVYKQQPAVHEQPTASLLNVPCCLLQAQGPPAWETMTPPSECTALQCCHLCAGLLDCSRTNACRLHCLFVTLLPCLPAAPASGGRLTSRSASPPLPAPPARALPAAAQAALPLPR